MIFRLSKVLCPWLLAATLASALHAMSVLPPSFPELVAEASVVARARVIEVTSRSVAGPHDQRVIKTFVTFTTMRGIKGQPGGQFTLSFLGGRADGEDWVVPGMPSFAVGDEEFIFTTAQETICPLVGAMHGRYRVISDPATGQKFVARDNRTPLRRTEDVARPMNADTAAPSAVGALSPEVFEQRVIAEIERPSRPTPPR